MDRLREIEDIRNEWEMIFYDAFMVTSDKPDKVTEDMRVRDIVKQFVKALWTAKELLKAEYKEGYLPVDCMGILNNIAVFAGEWYETPKKVMACKVIAKSFLDRVICKDETMFEDELPVGFDEIRLNYDAFDAEDDEGEDEFFHLSMPVYFYNIKEGDISPVADMIDELEGN